MGAPPYPRIKELETALQSIVEFQPESKTLSENDQWDFDTCTNCEKARGMGEARDVVNKGMCSKHHAIIQALHKHNEAKWKAGYWELKKIAEEALKGE